MPPQPSAPTSHPLVSVVMPAYNRADYIGAAIASVLRQSYPHWQLHIVDDGSRDGTPDVVRGFTDTRILYLQQPNAGQSAARNRAIAAAGGQYICFLDSDNLWNADKLEYQVGLARENPDFDVFYSDTQTISATGEPLPAPSATRWSGRVTDKLLRSNFVNFNTSLIRAQALRRSGGFDEQLRSGEDFDLWLRLSLHSQFHYSQKVLAQYRVTPGQISSDVWKNLRANKLILERFIEGNRGVLDPRAVRASWSRFFVRCGRAHASQSERGAAYREYLRALRHEPAGVHVWRSLVALTVFGR
jgi:glycosyltransferase involved in cell wall biosynthesis